MTAKAKLIEENAGLKGDIEREKLKTALYFERLGKKLNELSRVRAELLRIQKSYQILCEDFDKLNDENGILKKVLISALGIKYRENV